MNVESSAPKAQPNAPASSSAHAAQSGSGASRADRRAAALQAGGFSSFLNQALSSDASQTETLDTARSDAAEDDPQLRTQADGTVDSRAEDAGKPLEKAKDTDSGEAKQQTQADGAKQTDRNDDSARVAPLIDPNLLRTQAVSTASTAAAQATDDMHGDAATSGLVQGKAVIAGNAPTLSLSTSTAASGPAATASGPSAKSHGLTRAARHDADPASAGRKAAKADGEGETAKSATATTTGKESSGPVIDREEALARERNRRIEPGVSSEGTHTEFDAPARQNKATPATTDFASLLAATQVSQPGHTTGIELPPDKLALAELTQSRYEIQSPPGSPGFNDSLASQLGNIITNSVDRAEIQLNPRELGPIRVEVTLKDKDTHVVLSASQPMTVAALEQSAPQLRSLLSEQGLTLRQFDVATSFTSTDRGGQSQPDNSPRGDSRQPGSGGGGQNVFDGGIEATPAAARISRRLLDLFA